MIHIPISIRPRHGCLLLLLVVVTLFRAIPHWASLYTLHIYPLIARCIAPASNLVPFSLGDCFIAGSVLWLVLYPICARCIRRRRWKPTAFRMAEYLAWIYVWFYAAWGINYSQPGIYARTGLKPVPFSRTSFRDFAYRYADSLNATFQAAAADTCKILTQKEIQQNIADTYRTGRQVRLGIQAPFTSSIPAKTMLFSRLSSMAGVTGSMGPFFSEFTLNDDLQPHEYAATFAHEYAHFLGIANEGEANFYSYVYCTISSEPSVRFSGYYHIFFHMLRHVRLLLGEEEYKRFLRHIHPDVVRQARHDRTYWLSRRSTAIDSVQDFIFNLYLHGNHVEGGIRSYAGVVALIMAYEERNQTSRPSLPPAYKAAKPNSRLRTK